MLRIAIIGAGGVGGYLASMLAQEQKDLRVTLVARGSHLEALCRNGIRLERSNAADTLTLAPTAFDACDLTATTDVDADIVIVCVKMTDVQSVARQLQRRLKRRCLILPIQNGIEAHAVLTAEMPDKPIGKGTAHISAQKRADGVIGLVGTLARFYFSAPPTEKKTLQRLVHIAAKWGLAIESKSDSALEQLLWHKFIFLTAFSGLTTVTQQPLGVLRSHPQGMALFRQAMQETENVALAQGLRFSVSPCAQWFKRIETMPSSFRASMSIDYHNNRPLELPWLSAAVVRMGQKHGYPTPIHQMITLMLSCAG